MNKYKAPWRYIKEHGIIYDSAGEMVCDTMPSGEQWEEDNAALIECAPEMYEEIERDITRLENSKGYFDKVPPVISNEIRRKKKLLAKARGEHGS